MVEGVEVDAREEELGLISTCPSGWTHKMSSSSSPFSILVIPLEDLMIRGDSGGVGVGVDDGLHLPIAILFNLHSSYCIISDGGGGGGGLGVTMASRETSSDTLRCGGLYFDALGILDFFKGD